MQSRFFQKTAGISALLFLLSLCHVSSPAYDTSRSVSPSPVPETSETVSCSVRIVGDMMCLDDQFRAAKQEDGSFDFNPPFDNVRDMLSSADLTVGNLETVIDPSQAIHGELTGFNAPEEYLEAIKNCGFDVLITSNNHCLDKGLNGVYSTVRLIRGSGMKNVGTNLNVSEKDRFVVCDVNGLNVGFLSYTCLVNKISIARHDPDAAWAINFLDVRYNYEKNRLETALQAVKAAGAEAVVLFLHCGSEYWKSPTGQQKDLADFAFENGADIVIQSHTHTLQPVEKKRIHYNGDEKNVFVAYGMGNFMSSFSNTDCRRTIILNLDLSYDRSSKSLSIDPSYVAVTTEHINSAEKTSFSLIPIRSALENSIPTGLSETSLQKELSAIENRIGAGAASVSGF